MAKLANPKLAVTSSDWKRSTGGSLAPSYARSFGGLAEFYDNQRLPTQQQRLNQNASAQQGAAGGFYQPGFEPRMRQPTPLVGDQRMDIPSNLLPPSPRSMTPPPPSTLVNHGGGFFERPNPYGTATVQRALTEPAPTVSATPPPSLPSSPPPSVPPSPGFTRQSLAALAKREADAGRLNPTAAQASINALQSGDADVAAIAQELSGNFQQAFGELQNARQDNPTFAAPPRLDAADAAPLPTFGTGSARSANDPARMMETLARNNRRNPRAQGIAAGFFQEQDNIRYNREQDAAQLDAYQTRTNAMEEARNAAANARVQERKDRETAAAEQVRRQQEKDAIDLNFKLAEESRRAAEFAKTMVPAAPDMTVLPIPGTNNVYFPQGKTVLSSNTPPTPGMMEIAPGSGQYLPTFGGEPQPSLGTFTQESPALPEMPLPRNVPLGPFGNLPLPAMTLPGKPATFKPLNTNKDKEPTPEQRRKSLADKHDMMIRSLEKDLEYAEDTERPAIRADIRRLTAAFRADINGDGKVSAAEQQQAAAGGTAPPASPRTRNAPPPVKTPSGNTATRLD